MSLSLWRLKCSTCIRQGSRSYALAAFARQKSWPTRNPGPDSLFAEHSPDGLQWSAEIRIPTVATSARKLNLRRLSKKSLGPKEEILSQRNLLEQTKVQEYLDFVASTNDTVTLADIERCRPPEHGVPGTPMYESDYNSLLDTLVRSFSMKQLRRFLHLYQLDPPRKRTKWHFAASIIERQWGWPSLTEIQKQQRDWTEVTYADFTLDPREAFLVLGKDGADLLALSLQYNVHVSFSTNPLSLKAEGLRGSLDNLGRYINKFKDSIKHEFFELPFGRTSEQALLERISRLSGVFIENVGHGTIRMSYRSDDVDAARLARRLATRAAFELAVEVPTLVYSPTMTSRPATPLTIMSPYQYSFFPFLPQRASPRHGQGRNLFRLRRVGEWLPLDAVDNGAQNGALAGSGIVVNLAGKESDIRDALLSQYSGLHECVNGTKRVLTASFGHLLFPSPSSKRVTITSPLEGQLDFSQVLDLVNGYAVKPEFISSLPVPLLMTPPAEQRFIHRLIYHTLPAKVHETGGSHTSTALKFEITIGLPDTTSASGDTARSVEPSQQKPAVKKTVDLAPTCLAGPEVHLNLMIPDHSMDVRFTLFDCLSLPQDKWPQGLQNYFRDLQAFLSVEEGTSQPDVPLILEHQGVNYVLQSSSSIRQSSELVSSTVSGPNAPSYFGTISESSLDLESNQRSTVCQVICEDPTSDIAWKSFLSNCERLTSFRHNRRLET